MAPIDSYDVMPTKTITAHVPGAGRCSETASYPIHRNDGLGRPQLERELNRLRSRYESPPLTAPRMLAEQTDIHQNENTSTPSRTLLSVSQELSASSSPRLLVQSGTMATENWPSPKQDAQPGFGAAFIHPADIGQSSPARTISYDSQTMSRKIGALELSAPKVNGCFSMFRDRYAPDVLDIIDCERTPNEVYEYSVFLFWTIVYVGSRKYEDPTIVESLIKPLKQLARQSVFDPDDAISAIQAVVILCLWPLPTNSTFEDQSHALVGAAMQLAIQKGLPYAAKKQDFSRVPSRQSEGEKQFRARLWVSCMTVFQSTSLCDGFPFPSTMTPAGCDRSVSLLDGLPPKISYRNHLHRVHIDAVSTIMRAIDLDSGRNSELLNSLIDYFDAQALQVYAPEESDLSSYTLSSVRLMIRAFHLFTPSDGACISGVLQAYYISCELIGTASRLDRYQDFGNYCNALQARALACAAVCILRVQRSCLRARVSTGLGEDMFFEAIRLSKKHSIQNNDLGSRTAIILTQLWSSTRVFKFKDGSVDGLRLLLRGRLSMSIVFDCLWWWRAEFGGKSNPYIEQESEAPPGFVRTAHTTASATAPEKSDSLNDEPPMHPTTLPATLLDLTEVPDWNWEGLEDLDWNWN
ncbi:hypothetical protein GQ53DRAFT_841049 [Thozetella sp. PMI_491]|nr:hypothetical protein GQ53DRAFT_841049 [Thozetella sp. PMI_491]